MVICSFHLEKFFFSLYIHLFCFFFMLSFFVFLLYKVNIGEWAFCWVKWKSFCWLVKKRRLSAKWDELEWRVPRSFYAFLHKIHVIFPLPSHSHSARGNCWEKRRGKFILWERKILLAARISCWKFYKRLKIRDSMTMQKRKMIESVIKKYFNLNLLPFYWIILFALIFYFTLPSSYPNTQISTCHCELCIREEKW